MGCLGQAGLAQRPVAPAEEGLLVPAHPGVVLGGHLQPGVGQVPAPPEDVVEVAVAADALAGVIDEPSDGGEGAEVVTHEPLGVHPFLRLTPPRPLADFEPEHVLCGHGEGVHEHAAEAVREALAHARRRLPRLLVEAPATAMRR